MGFAQGLPLGGKLRVLLHQGHEIPGEGVGAGAVHRSHHQFHGHGDEAQVRAPGLPVGGDEVVQHRQVGVLPPAHAGAEFLLPLFQGVAVT